MFKQLTHPTSPWRNAFPPKTNPSVTNPALPFSYSGNTCVTFTASPGTSGDITNNGTVTASGTTNPNSTGISLYVGPTVTGNIVNKGTINAFNEGIFLDQAKLNGSITNFTAICVTRSLTVGMPNGRVFPGCPGLSMCTRRTNETR